MIVIVVEHGRVQAVFSDEPEEDVKILSLDEALDIESEVTPQQMRCEIKQVRREMHQVL